MYDVVSIGSISCDLFFSDPSLTTKDKRFFLAFDGKYVAHTYLSKLGGGGLNVAIGAARHNVSSALWGILGKSTKHDVLTLCRKEQISTVFCDQIDSYENISVILLTDKGERTIIHHTSPHMHSFNDRAKLQKLLSSRIVYFGNMSEVSLTERLEAIRFLHAHHVPIVLNLGVKDARRKKGELYPLLERIDILIVNAHEFSELVKAPYKDIHFHDDVVSWYARPLRNKIVVITNGKSGSFAYQNGQIYHQKAEEVDRIIDTTGAGDAYTSAFIASFLKTSDIELSMKQATSYASKILTRIGAH